MGERLKDGSRVSLSGDTFSIDKDGHRVSFDFSRDSDGEPFLTRVTFERFDGKELSTRVMRQPLGRFYKAALARLANPSRSGRVNFPRSPHDYERLARAAEAIQAKGGSPAKEIAEHYGVPTNRVHQWFETARQLGYLARHKRRRGTKARAAAAAKPGTIKIT